MLLRVSTASRMPQLGRLRQDQHDQRQQFFCFFALFFMVSLYLRRRTTQTTAPAIRQTMGSTSVNSTPSGTAAETGTLSEAACSGVDDRRSLRAVQPVDAQQLCIAADACWLMLDA